MLYIILIGWLGCKTSTQTNTFFDRSHDGFETRSDGILEPKAGSKYASQRIVFDNLGQGVLDNAFEGKINYNV